MTRTRAIAISMGDCKICRERWQRRGLVAVAVSPPFRGAGRPFCSYCWQRYKNVLYSLGSSSLHTFACLGPRQDSLQVRLTYRDVYIPLLVCPLVSLAFAAPP